jgi:hypothetical protein
MIGALNDELLWMTYAYTDKLSPETPFEAGRVAFPVSRLVCDVERSRKRLHDHAIENA